MKFGQLINGYLKLAKFPIEHDGRTYYSSDPDVMLSLGYKEVVYTTAPTSETGVYKPTWTETDTQIVQEWIFEAYTEEQLAERYKKLTVKYIREKYSTNQEFAILREYMTYGETYKEAFDEYSNYVESCKERAHAEIYADETTN